nr:hypothetical protein [Lachnospiraceae bacterium]
MSNTVFFHFGTPKTGTSALQDFLMDNNPVLEKYHVFYPLFDVNFLEIGANRNGHFLYYIRGNEYQKEYESCMEKLNATLSDNSDIILSDEGLWYWQNNNSWWNEFEKWCSGLDADIKVIVYLRRQEDLVESLWNQKIKGFKKSTDTFDEFLKSDYCERLPLDYESSLERIEKLTGKENLIVRPYDFNAFYNG